MKIKMKKTLKQYIYFETFHKEKSGVFEKKTVENENFIAAALHRELWYLKKTNILQHKKCDFFLRL